MSDNQGTRQHDTTRRATLRSLAAAATATPLALGVAAAESGDSRFHAPEQAPELPHPDATLYKYDDSLRKITSHPYLLALSEQAIDGHFDSSNLKGREFERARAYLRRLRKRYPVERVDRGNEIVFQLSREARRNLHMNNRSARPLVEGSSQESRPSPSEGGRPSIQSAADRNALKAAIGAFATIDGGGSTGDDIDPLWTKNNHVTMLDVTLSDLSAAGDFNSWAKRPDEFASMANGRLDIDDGDVEIPTSLPSPIAEDVVQNAIGTVFKETVAIIGDNYTQYYNPAKITLDGEYPLNEIRFGGTGMAPQAAQIFYDDAKDANDNSQSQRKKAAFASHYVQDMGNPLHTGMAIEQAGAVVDIDVDADWGIPPEIRFDATVGFNTGNHWLHYGYEQLIENRWDDLVHHFSGSYAPFIDDGADAVRSVANETHQYANDIFHTIYENEHGSRSDDPGAWGDDTKSVVLEDTGNCLTYTGRYNRSLLLDLNIGERPTIDCPYRPCPTTADE